MVEKIREIKKRVYELERLISSPEVIRDLPRLNRLQQEYARLSEIVAVSEEYNKIRDEIEKTKKLLEDSELRELALKELELLREKEKESEEKLRRSLLPQNPDWSKDCIVEIRAAAGGEEASLFAADLFRMYSKYIAKKGWRIEVLSTRPTGLGGFKEVIFSVQGDSPYKWLRFERGVHRVQRVPKTEAYGRVHTSTVTVAVLPEATPVEVKIDPSQLRIEVFRASGHGGQHVNVTDSAVRITHLPTGIVVSCQDERSQHQNRAKAMRILRSRLLDLRKREKEREIAESRKTQIGTGERAEKIRTYNFPQNRVTDHRIGLTLHNLEEVLDGDLEPILSSLLEKEAEEFLKRDEGERAS